MQIQAWDGSAGMKLEALTVETTAVAVAAIVAAVEVIATAVDVAVDFGALKALGCHLGHWA